MICNLSQRTVLARRPITALGFFSRARGMLFRQFDDFDAMIFHNCNCIHTIGMQFPIDLVFVDRENRICEIRKHLIPWTPFVRHGNAEIVIELPDGSIEISHTEKNDIIDLNAELTEAMQREMAKKGLVATPGIILPLQKDCRKS